GPRGSYVPGPEPELPPTSAPAPTRAAAMLDDADAMIDDIDAERAAIMGEGPLPDRDEALQAALGNPNPATPVADWFDRYGLPIPRQFADLHPDEQREFRRIFRELEFQPFERGLSAEDIST